MMVENTVVIKMEATFIINEKSEIEILHKETLEDIKSRLCADDLKIISTKVFPREIES